MKIGIQMRLSPTWEYFCELYVCQNRLKHVTSTQMVKSISILQQFAGIFPPSFQSHKCDGNVLCLVAFYEESTDYHLLKDHSHFSNNVFIKYLQTSA